MRVMAGIQGNLEAYMKSELEAATEGVVRGLQEAAQGLKSMLRAQVVSAGLGRRLSKTWQSKFYPNRRIDAAELVYSKAPKIIGTFNLGVTIQPKAGEWLAIPTNSVRRSRIGRFRSKPGDFNNLIFLTRGQGKGILIERVRKEKKLRGKKNKGKVKIVYQNKPMFFLVKKVLLKKRLDIRHMEERISALFPRLIQKHYAAAAGGE